MRRGLVFKFGCTSNTSGSFKKYLCLGHICRDSQLIGLGHSMDIQFKIFPCDSNMQPKLRTIF